MKICFLCNYPVNELSTDYIIRLGTLLESADNEVIIIAQTNQYIYQRSLVEELPLLPVESLDEELTISATYRLNQSLKLEAPDVLMVFNKENISAGVLLKKAALPDTAKLVFWQTEVFSEKNKGFWAGLKDSVWDSKMLKLIDLWISPLDPGNDYFKNYTSLPQEKLHHIFPQLNPKLNTHIPKLKIELKIPEGETIIGLIEDKKLLDDAISLINCIAKLREKGYDVNGMILLSENGIYSSKRLALYQHAIAKKVEHYIEIITKEQANEQEFIHLSDILLIPEPSLFRHLEAFAAGTLTIVSKHQINKLLTENGELGLKSVFEGKKLAKKITEYLDDSLFSEIISERSRRKMNDKALELAYAENLLKVMNS